MTNKNDKNIETKLDKDLEKYWLKNNDVENGKHNFVNCDFVQ